MLLIGITTDWIESLKTKRVLFLVQNGIGFGHLRRTLTVAEALNKDGIEIIFIAQTKSLKLLENTRFKVINFPFLHRLPNNELEQVYIKLLDELIWKLEPDLFVEDTHPNLHYYGMPSLRNVPRVLIIRRIDPLYLELYRESGILGLYDKIIFTQSREEFLADTHTIQNRWLAELSARFLFAGPIYYTPSDAELISVKKKYGNLGSLVVINAGAGGNHIKTNYCETLFNNVLSISRRWLLQRPNVHFILVTGPYFDHKLPDHFDNLTIVSYEPYLPALFYLAKVAILRPGFNVTLEALSAKTQLLLAPTVSYMETQEKWGQGIK